MQVILIKTPLALVREDPQAEQRWVEKWAAPLSKLQRIYLKHSYDEEAGVGFDYIGIRRVYSKQAGGKWTQHAWRETFNDSNPFYKDVRLWAKLTHHDDRDFFDSEDEEVQSEDGWV